MATLHVRQDSLPTRAVIRCGIDSGSPTATCPVEQYFAHGLRQIAPRRIEAEAIALGEPRKNHLTQVPVGLTPGQDHAFE